jgi:hypothetical protein
MELNRKTMQHEQHHSRREAGDGKYYFVQQKLNLEVSKSSTPFLLCPSDIEGCRELWVREANFFQSATSQRKRKLVKRK